MMLLLFLRPCNHDGKTKQEEEEERDQEEEKEANRKGDEEDGKEKEDKGEEKNEEEEKDNIEMEPFIRVRGRRWINSKKTRVKKE